MKVLYIGSERSEAQAVATALRSIDEKVSILWASQLEQATGWLDENRDVAALIMEAPIDGASCLAAQRHLRRLALPPAVVFIVPDGISPTLDSLHPGADYVRRNQTLSRDLPLAVTRAIERGARVALEQKLAQATAALHDTEQRHQAALAASAEQLAASQAQYEIGMARANATWDMVDEQLRTAALEVERARQQQEAAAADVERLSRLLADTEATLAVLNTRTAQERLAAEDQQRELQWQISKEIDQRRNIELLLADAVSAQEEAERRHASAMSEAAAQSHALEDALRQARIEVTAKDSDIDRLTTNETSLRSRIEEVSGHHRDLERRLAATQAAFDDAALRATRERLAVSKRAAEREAELDGLLHEERTTRAALEQAIAEAQAAAREAQQRHDAALAAAAAELAERQACFDRERVKTTADRDDLARRLTDADAALDTVRRDYAAEVDRLMDLERGLRVQLADLQDARDTIERQSADAARQAAGREAALDSQLQEERTTRAALEQRIADAEAAFDESLHEYQSAVAEIERLADRATGLVAQLAEVQAAHDALARQLADAETAIHEAAVRHRSLEAEIQQERTTRDELDRVLVETRSAALERESAFEVQLAQAQLEHEHRLADVRESSRTLEHERDTLQQSLASLQEQVQQLQQSLAAGVEQLEASQGESHRLFDQAGVPMFRCSRDGALIDVNRACATLVGRRALDEVGGIEFAPAVFEDPNVLSWLIERCLTTRTKESIETTWRRQDGSRLFVRLSARSLNATVVEIIAEDLTRIRVLEERLGRANRMEAVGRLALEVAVTCGALLTSIHQKGQNWLTTIENAGSRHDGEGLFEDVGRAAGFLRDLAACGDEQGRTSTLVDLNTLIRDLEPVLKRVAGGDVEVQLRDTSSPLNVDVGTERVERLLVNLASYGRGRMPSGGRLRIELGTSVVDRRFVAKHPNVRMGLHALITVTETGRPAGSDEERGRAAARPAVDFGTLQELVSECGGHLWMKVQPPGDMVAKIRLPLSSAREQGLSRTAIRTSRDRTASRWFQS